MDEFSEIQKNQVISLIAVWLYIALILPIVAWVFSKNKYMQVCILCTNLLFQKLKFYTHRSIYLYFGLQMYVNPNLNHAFSTFTYFIMPFILIIICILESGYGYISFLYITSVEVIIKLLFNCNH